MKKIILILLFIAGVIAITALVRYGAFAPEEPVSVSGTDGWLTATTSGNGIKFLYPALFDTKYVNTFDWPPMAEIYEKIYSCRGAGSETAEGGKTERRVIGGREYCVTSVTEGAAGSVYTEYAYAFPNGKKTVILTFTTKAPQCGNYPDLEREECEKERNAFDLDALVDRMARTLTVRE